MKKNALSAIVLALFMSGCGLTMTEQRKYATYTPSDFWSDGASARPLPKGVVAQGDLEREAALANPPPVTPQLVTRGRERFEIYCAPCHGLAGDGDGIIIRHGFPTPPSYHSDDLVSSPPQRFLDAITNGYGVMYSYAARVEPKDRWAIVAYIRALQLTRRPLVAAAAGGKTP